MNPRRILTVFGTRTEAIKLFALLRALAADPRFVSRVCASATHRAIATAGKLVVSNWRPGQILLGALAP